MKEKIGLLLAIMLIFSMAACSGSDSETSQGDTSTISEAEATELSLQTKLILGTFKLEETDLAVAAEQASSLLPLWKAVRSLSQSDTAAEAELTALVSQIQETMTPEQIEAIDVLELKPQDMFTIIQDLGLRPGFAQGSTEPGGNSGDMPFIQEFRDDFRPGEGQGGGPGGGAPGGSIEIRPGEGMSGGGVIVGPGGFGQELDPEQMATMEARGAGRSVVRDQMMGLFLLDPLIELLQGKIQS